MPRTKSDIPKGSFALKLTPNGKGEEPIYIRYFVQGKYAVRSTDIWVLPKDWDKKGQKVKSSNKSAVKINTKLDSLKRKVDDQLFAYDDGPITIKAVQEMLDGGYLPEDEKARGVQFVDYCNNVNEIKYRREDNGYSVYYNAQQYIKHFQTYLKEEKHLDSLTLSQVSKELLDEYVVYLKQKQARRGKSDSNEAINKAISPLIKAIKYAKDNGQLSAQKAQPIIEGVYLDIKNRTYNPDDADCDQVRYLTDEQLEQFINYKPKSVRASATNDIKDIFLFSLYSCGLRISDIVTLEWKQINFDTKKIEKIQVKTKEKSKVSPRLPQQSLDILDSWKKRNLNSRFVFNYLPEDFVFGKETEGKLKMRINAVDRTINISLNHIGIKLGFPFPLTIHVARHTFCVKALSSGMSLHVVSQLMGHSSILATEKTYARYLDSSIDNEIEKLYSLFEK